MKGFSDILAIARENVTKNPKLRARTTEIALKKYLEGLVDEVREVKEEIREDNEIHLVDELSDIAWNYAVLLELLAERGLIPEVDVVMEHAHEKYTQRMPAFLEGSSDLWSEIKSTQKQELKKKHEEKYGN